MKVGILGFGNVAGATVDSFLTNQKLINAKTRSQIEIVRVATRTPARAIGHVPSGCEVSSDCWSLVNDPHVDVVVELLGDVKLGRELVLRALHNRKHIVTANKALMALHGEEIMTKAEENQCSVLFEGAIAVSIPIVKFLRESAAANQISSISGILNGTSNYVLSQMGEHSVDLDNAIKAAQKMGYAEADPTLDLNGEDATHKLALLASLGFGIPINFTAVEYKGIQEVALLDINHSKYLGFKIKLLAQAQKNSRGIALSVHPTLVPDHSLIAKIGGAMNGIYLQGDLMGSAFLYGSGAGGRQTSSAILADLIDLANGRASDPQNGSFNMGFSTSHYNAIETTYVKQQFGSHYVRLTVPNDSELIKNFKKALAEARITAEVQKMDGIIGDNLVNLIIITRGTTTSHLENIIPKLPYSKKVKRPAVIYPIYEDREFTSP